MTSQQNLPLSEAQKKILQRRERNKQSARACRKRKREAIENLIKQVDELEAENLNLRVELQIGEEVEKIEMQEKIKGQERLLRMIENGVSPVHISNELFRFKERYAEFGRDRRIAIDADLTQLEKVMNPTRLTRLVLWLLSQPDNAKQISNSNGMESELIGLLPAQQNHLIKEIYRQLIRDLEIDEFQEQQLLEHKKEILELVEDLNLTYSMISELRELLQNRNYTLDRFLETLQGILTPEQSVKYMYWIDNNRACVALLNQLWNAQFNESENANLVSQQKDMDDNERKEEEKQKHHG